MILQLAPILFISSEFVGSDLLHLFFRFFNAPKENKTLCFGIDAMSNVCNFGSDIEELIESIANFPDN